MPFNTTWSTITSAQTDADSPLDVTLLEGIRQNLIHLYDWIGQGYTPAINHNHDGVNSVSVVLADLIVNTSKLAASAVTNAKIAAGAVGSSAIQNSAIISTLIGATAVEAGHLKLSQGTISVVSATTTIVSINRYSHIPRLEIASGATGNQIRAYAGMDGVNVAVDRLRFITEGAGTTWHVYWDYHSS